MVTATGAVMARARVVAAGVAKMLAAVGPVMAWVEAARGPEVAVMAVVARARVAEF